MHTDCDIIYISHTTLLISRCRGVDRQHRVNQPTMNGKPQRTFIDADYKQVHEPA